MSKLQRLRDNIDAIKHAFSNDLPSGCVMDAIQKFSGFGGLGFVLNSLNPCEWTKNDMVFYADTVRLHQLLKDNSRDERQYEVWLQSLKSSTLTAYYTPREIVKVLDMSFSWMDVDPDYFLDPASGNGAFIKLGACAKKTVAYEKDLLTGLLLENGMYGHWENVSVRTKGFETIPSEDLGRFDIVSTNVPFGDIKVFDPAYSNSKDAVLREAARYIHRYYVLKGLDCLRNGGIEAYIITSNYLNRDSEQLREALKSARLVGAYRLAGNLFKEAGTEVGTDLLVLQKEEGREGLTPAESMLLTTYEDNGCPTNLYFTCYPDHVIATDTKVGTDAYGKPGFVYTHKDGVKGIATDLEKVFDEDLKVNLDVDLYEKNRVREKKARTAKEKKAEEPKYTKRETDMVFIHETYDTLYKYESEKQEENAELRRGLNKVYDEFVLEFGLLNSSENARTAKKMNISDVLSLEVRDEQGKWQKADIMLRPIAFSTDDLHEANTPQEALAQSLNDYGRPDMGYMSALTGMTEEELQLALSGEIYYNPLSCEYEIAAKFICGNVIEKLEKIKSVYGIADKPKENDADSRSLDVRDTDPRVLNAVAALEAAVPTPIPFDDLDFNLGERWIDPDVYGAFASDFFSMPENPNRSWSGGKTEITVKYQPLLDQFAASCSRSNEKIWTQYSVLSEASQRLDGMDLLVHALHNTCPKMMRYKRDSEGRVVYDDNYDKVKEEDPEKTQLANTKIEEIRQGFVDWLQRQPKDFCDGLADVYNRRFNCFVKPKYDGSHQTFPDIDRKGLKEKYGIEHIYGSQKDCVWMLLLNGGGICDHEVGSGKTLIMCIAAHEMKRLGMCHKPMIIGLKANVSAIAETYRTAYPQCKILFAKESDYSGENRVAFFNQAKANDYDCIIMSHDQFSRIPQSDEIQMEILRDELQQLEDSLHVVDDWGWSLSKRVRRGLETRKRNMEAKILKLQNDLDKKRDDVVDFNMLGIDHIFVDESHQFKNLGFSTRHDRVAGMGNTEGSKRAFNLLMAIRTIQKRTGRDLGATFLSGTTVTNSLTELYSLFRYLRPKAMAKQNITCFDAWAAIFTKKSQEFEFSITNQIVLKERFRYFIKVPELAMFYNEITDFRTAADVGIDRPEKHAMLLNIKPTPDQEEFIGRLMKFAQNGDFELIGIHNPTDKQRKAKMLYATDLARKMSLDMRMIDTSYQDHPRSKASRCAQLIKRYYDQYNEQKGTQMVFSDLSTWQNNQEWSVYNEIKKKLVEEYGIPEREVRFIQECKCDSKKQALIKEVNEGKVRVLFGSTSMLGTGVNAQKRVVAVHHLDTPWRPSDLEQRDGRAIRKGNEVAKFYADNKVDIIIYAVERSLDSYKFNLLHCKQTFINQLKRGQLSIRTLDEGSFDENTGMNFSEYMAILSGNTDLLERAKLEKKIAALEGERKNFLREEREQQQKKVVLEQENEQYAKWIADAKADYDRFEKNYKEGDVNSLPTVDGFTNPDNLEPGSDEWMKAVGERLLKISDTFRTDGAYIAVGSVCGFPIVVKTNGELVKDLLGNERMEYENLFFVEGGRLKHSYNKGKLNHTSARISAAMPLEALRCIPMRIEQWEAKLENNRISIEQLESFMGKEWPKEGELKKLRADLGILDRKINEELTAGKTDGQEGKAHDQKDGRASVPEAA